MSAIRVLLADDQRLVRTGFRVILEVEDDIEVVGEAADGARAAELAATLRPDVVLMDVEMPGVDGLEGTRRITAAPGAPAVLILTTFDRDDYLFAALQAGASGFLLKNGTPEDLVDAVRILYRGDALLAPEITRRVIATFAAPPGRAPRTDPALLDGLTPREREVLELLGRGVTNAEIAAALYLGEATVKTHVSRVLAKLGLRDRTQAVVFAYEHGVVRPGG
ncbi:Response regulator protein VraR [Micromonospora sp. MW-13]|uniref:response regulator n=1 Tax=unclassified Micromonospora TaxID=2617518 RepID=UPI000E44AC4E|nr:MULTISPECIES: response regulator transcription factor [unclassified Micromonospora]MCX4472462.1 response regulator transcription factor [Micromonospora sp. NBC_01655]RGC69576.1 Response regulator protein VraR [Micromonospora sp. MW-13]